MLEARRRRGLVAVFDFDGTLVPIAQTPDHVRARPALRRALGHLARRADTLVAVVSGRPLAELRRFVGAPGVWLVGLHGYERQAPGRPAQRRWSPSAARAALRVARRLERRLREVAAVRIEHKGPGLAVHVRGLQPRLRHHIERVVRASCPPGFETLAGRRVLELRPSTAPTKGDAIRWIAQRRPTAALLFVGDDLTDEAGFAALGPLDFPVLVDDRAARRERPRAHPTRARYRVADRRAVDLVIARLSSM